MSLKKSHSFFKETPKLIDVSKLSSDEFHDVYVSIEKDIFCRTLVGETLHIEEYSKLEDAMKLVGDVIFNRLTRLTYKQNWSIIEVCSEPWVFQSQNRSLNIYHLLKQIDTNDESYVIAEDVYNQYMQSGQTFGLKALIISPYDHLEKEIDSFTGKPLWKFVKSHEGMRFYDIAD